MKRFFVFLVVLLASSALVFGCGGSKKKDKTAKPGGPVMDDPYGVGTGGPVGAGDQSTGDAVPTGPGEAAPEQHIMAENAKGYYNEGVKAGANGNLDQAEQAFKQAFQIDGKSHQVAYNLGVLSERRGNDDGARGYYRQAISLQPDYLPALAALAKLEMRLKNVTAAIGLMKGKATAYPKNIGIMNRYADTLIAGKRYTDAIAVAKQVLRIDERNAEAMFRVAKANMRMGRYELAESIFDQVLAIDPDVAEVYFLKAQIKLEKDGNKVEAIADLETALQKNPYYIEAMNNLAIQYILSGNYDIAIEKLEKALVLSPSWPVLYLNYGNALRGAGRWKEARVNLEKARSLDSSLLSALFNLGVLYFVATDLDNLDRIGSLGVSRRHFSDYKNEKGSSLKKKDPVHKYVKEIDISIEREETRIQQKKEMAQREAELAKEREAAEAAKAAGGGAVDAGSGGDKGWEDEDEGWE